MVWGDIKSLLTKININLNGYIEKFEIEQFQKENPTIPLNGIQEGMFIGNPMDGLCVERTTIQENKNPQSDIFHKDSYYTEPKTETTTPTSFDDINSGWLGTKDARNCDISHLLLTREQLMELRVDSTTIMNDYQKQIIDAVSEKMKDPGLGIRQLHQNGITGKGVTLAIIDSPLSYNSEFADRIVNYTNLIPDSNAEGSFHGNMVASRAVGKDCGVAPDAQLVHYTANSCETYSQAISAIIEQNKQLKQEGKPPISVISISCGFDSLESDDPNYNKNYTELKKIIKQAESQGIAVITNEENSGINLCPVGRDPDGDVNDPANYTLWRYMKRQDGEIDVPSIYKEKLENADGNILLLPGENCTVAGEHNDYRYESNDGGESWCPPYLAGVFALAKQVNPNITFDDFYKIALETADNGFDSELQMPIGKIINPQRIIDRCKK